MSDDEDLTAEEWAEVCWEAARFDWIVPPPKSSDDLLPAMRQITALQQLETEILDAHAEWLARTKKRFEENGWRWTKEELNKRYQMGQCE